MPPAVDAVPPDFDEAVAAARAAEPIRVERAPAALLLGAPGGGAELIATILRDEPGLALLSERFGPQARSDAFSAIEGRYASPTESEARVQARRYERALAHLKVPPGRAMIDWLPHWDLRLLPLALQIFGDVPLIVAARDLRDALLQWLAHGSAQGWRIEDPEAAAEWLARSAAQLEWTVAHAGVPVLVVDPTEALADPAGTRARLLAFLGQPPSTRAGGGAGSRRRRPAEPVRARTPRAVRAGAGGRVRAPGCRAARDLKRGPDSPAVPAPPPGGAPEGVRCAWKRGWSSCWRWCRR